MEIFSLIAKLAVDSTDFNSDLSSAEEKMKGLEQSTGGFIQGVKDAFAERNWSDAIRKFGTFMDKSFNKTLAHADAIDKNSQALGISTKAYQELDYALSMSGSDVDSLSTGIKNLNDIMTGKETGNAAKKLNELGVSLTYVNGEAKSTEAVLEDTIMALAGMEDITTRDSIVETLFGKRAGQQMKAFLNEGQVGITKLMAEADSLGLVMSDESIKQAVKAQDEMDKLNALLDQLVYTVMEPFVPIVSNIATLLTPAVQTLAQWIASLVNGVTQIVNFFSSGSDVEEWTASGKDVFNALYNTNPYAFRQNLIGRYGAEVGQGLFSRYMDYANASDADEKERLLNNVFANLGEAEKNLSESAGDAYTSLQNFTNAVDWASEALSQIQSLQTTDIGGTHRTGSFASGLWDVPAEGMYHLHPHEIVLNESRANDYRHGSGTDGQAIVSAIQRLETTLSNLRLMVGEKEFGRATTDYGGRRMNNYIGAADGRIAAGYGS